MYDRDSGMRAEPESRQATEHNNITQDTYQNNISSNPVEKLLKFSTEDLRFKAQNGICTIFSLSAS